MSEFVKIIKDNYKSMNMKQLIDVVEKFIVLYGKQETIISTLEEMNALLRLKNRQN